MPYSNNIPQATDRPSDSQPLILANFTAINTVNSVNHVAFDDPSGDQGKHKHVSFPEQAASPATAANEVALYSKQSTYSGVAELTLRKESSGSEIEFTAGRNVSGVYGWSILPSGVLVKWGNSQWNVGFAQTTSFVVPSTGTSGPTFASINSMQATPFFNGATDFDMAITLIGFTVGTQALNYHCSKRTSTAAVTATAVPFYYVIFGTPA